VNKPLAFIEYIPLGEREMFSAKVRAIANRIMVDPNWIMAVMYKESKLNPKAKNPNGTAIGLIQFLESTAKWLGTSTAALYQMTATQQLQYVEKYLLHYFNKKGPFRDYYDLYFSVLDSSLIGKPDDYLWAAQGSKTYEWNKGLDLDKNGRVSVGEIKAWFLRQLPSSFANQLQKKK
jgi:hypothetical protein